MDNNNQEETTPTPPIENEAPVETPENAPVVTEEVNVKQDNAANSNDINKVLAIVGYIFPFLFFIPLITDAKNDKFARFHAGQQLNLLLFWIIGQVIAGLTTAILIGILLYPIIYVGGIVLMVIGIINVIKDVTKDLPLIGQWHLLK